ncbi:hypothetical protein PV772_19165 [Pseudarthrobacter sp. CC12]|uniref:hypothetical protein n=1 Tax=Pseudarthrobacter sp. CC12 TaxID=3029193 RepID=UPI0032650A92
MITTAKVRQCDLTGLTLVRAAGEISFRAAKDHYGGLSVRKNSFVGPLPIRAVAGSGSRGRYDSIGSTIYLAESCQCAYAEVLLGFRQQRASVAKAAESIGWTVEDYIASVRAQAGEKGCRPLAKGPG